jgi:hypothetical protein
MEIGMIDNLCCFISTFKQRKYFIDHFVHYYRTSGLSCPLYVFSDEEDRTSDDMVIHIKDNYSSNADHLGRIPEWGHRLKDAISFLKKKYDYAIFSVDDGLFLDVDTKRFFDIFEKFKLHDGDYFSLQHDFKNVLDYVKIDDDFLLMEKKNLTYYVTHQTSLWKLDSLDKITEYNDIALDHEGSGFSRIVKNNINLHCYDGNRIFDSVGICHWQDGITDKFKKYLMENFND